MIILRCNSRIESEMEWSLAFNTNGLYIHTYVKMRTKKVLKCFVLLFVQQSVGRFTLFIEYNINIYRHFKSLNDSLESFIKRPLKTNKI